MIPTPITDHADQAIDRLIEHFSGPDKLTTYGLIRTLVKPYQELEDIIWQVVYGRLLDPAPGRTERAEGVQLDVLGKIVGCAREGLDDTTYRLRIRLQIRINRSFGTPVDVLEVARLALGVSYPAFVHREEYHHVTYLYTPAITVPTAVVLVRAMEHTRAAGTRVMTEYYTDRISSGSLFLWANGATGGQGGFANGSTAGSGGNMTSVQG